MKLNWKSFLLSSCFREASVPVAAADYLRDSPNTKPIQKSSYQPSLISESSHQSDSNEQLSVDNPLMVSSNLHNFTLAEIRQMTKNLSTNSFLGEGGFGPVHKGFIDENLRPGKLEIQTVAVKLLDLDGPQGHREWLTEVVFLGQLRHRHVVKLIGYCCEDEHRMLVYEYMPKGCLEKLLFNKYAAPLPWSIRMKIALGAAKGLCFLHESEKSVIYRDFKTSNILLESDYTAKISDFGLAKDGPEGEETHVSTRVMGTEGYAAPEYIMTGHLTSMSDVYSFGVVLLELITGQRSLDKTRKRKEQTLAEYARPMLKDPIKLARIIDPRLDGVYSDKGVRKAGALAYLCLSYRPKERPSMKQVVTVLESVVAYNDVPHEAFVYTFEPEHGNSRSEGERRRGHVQRNEQRKRQGASSAGRNQLL